jgi:phage head maturation protease
MVEEEKWDTVDGVDVRELRRVRLFDVSPVTFPAYPSTDVGVRAMESYENYRAEVRNKEEMKSRAAEKAAAKRKIESLKTKWRYL